MFVLRLVYPVTQPWAFGLFPPLAIVNNAVVNTDVQIAARVHAFDSFGVYPGLELLGHTLILCLIF